MEEGIEFSEAALDDGRNNACMQLSRRAPPSSVQLTGGLFDTST